MAAEREATSERVARLEEAMGQVRDEQGTQRQVLDGLRVKVAVIEAKVALYAALGSAVASVVVGFAFRAWG